MRRLSWVARGLIAAYTVSGTLHLLRPELFERTMPRLLPRHRELIVLSGIAEIACAVGLAVPATRRIAGPASAALLVAIVPANIQLAVDATHAAVTRRRTPKRIVTALIALVRVPLQWPLISASLAAGRR